MKVFISYSHDNDDHKNWVRKLAEDLTNNGIETILDVWHLRVADDLGFFMEKSIRESDYTLLICTPTFSNKVNNRQGGVTYEANLIIGNFLNNFENQSKFIPLLKEGLPSESIPMYLRSKLFLDFSNRHHYDQSLDTLLRRIYDAPLYTPPKLGTIPAFLTKQKNNSNFVAKARILVAGTGVISHLNNKIESVSIELGKRLAQNGFALTTGGWPGVDEIVARSFSEELYKVELPIEDYLTQVIVKTYLPTYPGGNLILIDEGKEEWTEPVKNCDAIVMIHGLGGTFETAEYGIKYNKPVFPIADSGGDANKMYVKILSTWGSYPYKNFNKLEFQGLGGIANYTIDKLIKLLNKQFLK